MEFISALNKAILHPIFGIPFAVLFISGASIFLFISLKFINFRKTLTKQTTHHGDVSKLGAFLSAAGGTLGVGNIFGGAMAVTIAGPGAIVWIIIFGIFSSIIKFCEVYLGHKFRKIEGKAVFGGSFLYIEKAFGAILGRKIAIFYAACFYIAYLAAGTFQVNQIASMIKSYTPTNPTTDIWLKLGIGCSICVITAVTLFGGIKRIANILTKIVPSMAAVYFLSALFLLISNNEILRLVLSRIATEALSPNVSGGLLFVLGYSLHRILFASDIGTGVSAIANSQSNVSAIEQAKLVTWEPILVAIVMAITGVCVLVTGADMIALNTEAYGVQIVSIAFSQNSILQCVIIAVVVLFGLTTTISHGYNVQEAWKYVHRKSVRVSGLIYTSCIIGIPFVNLQQMMEIIDLSFFLCIFINLIAIMMAKKFIKND